MSHWCCAWKVSCENVFGVNLSGNHATTITGPHYVTMGPVDLSLRAKTRLRFHRWLNTNALATHANTTNQRIRFLAVTPTPPPARDTHPPFC